MEQHNSPDWKLIASQEHEQRKQMELQMESTLDALNAARSALKNTSSYSQFLESKFSDLDAKYATQATNLHRAVEILKKARNLLGKRKQELQLLRSENTKLQTALTKKTELLQSEILQHEQTKQKLAALMAALPKPESNGITIASVTKTSNPADELEQYFANKILISPSDLPNDAALQADTDFMQQLLYIDQQFKRSHA